MAVDRGVDAVRRAEAGAGDHGHDEAVGNRNDHAEAAEAEGSHDGGEGVVVADGDDGDEAVEVAGDSSDNGGDARPASPSMQIRFHLPS